MAIIYSYPEKTTPAGGDLLVITDSEQPAPKKNRTKSLKVSDLGDYIITSNSVITGGGTLNTIAMFTPDGQKIGDSRMVEIGYAIQVGTPGAGQQPTLLGDSFISTQAIGTTQLTVDNISAQQGGIVSLIGNVIIGDQATDILQISSSVSDYTGTGSTAAGQVLVSNASSQLEWTNIADIPGSITGSGTLNTVAMFTPNGQAIGDSIITQNTGATSVTINGGLDVIEDLNVTGDIETSSNLSVTGNATFLSTITAGGGTGTAGQLLSSTGTGVEWVDDTTTGTVTGTGTTNTLPVWTDGPNGVLGDSKVYQDNSNIRMLAGSPSGAKCDYSFGIETFSGQKQGTTNGFEFKTGGQSGGFYKSGGFRFENKLAVGRTFDPSGATLDVGTPSDIVPAAYFRNGVVLSNNPGGVQVDNTSMVIGAGNNDVVSGSDNCLTVGNNNRILSDSDNSLAVGQGNTITNNADNCFVIGQSNEINGANVPFGNSVRSQVLGYDNLLFGGYSCFIAGGDNNVQTPNNAFALGYSHLLRGQDSQFAFGENCTGPIDNTSQNSFMIGSNLQGVDGNMVIGFRNDTSSYPAIDYPNGLGETKFVVSVGSNATSNAIIITEGGVNRGNPNVEQIPRIILPQQETLEFTSDANATAAGIPTGGLYRNGNDLKINFNETAAGGNEGLAYLTPQLLTASPGGSGNIDPNYNLVLLSWTLGNGVYTLNLPLASANTNRLIRITTDGSLSPGAGDKIDITATGGETIDGAASFQISKQYEGLAVFSTGSEWIIVQAKAH